jgi:hypothetical protein
MKQATPASCERRVGNAIFRRVTGSLAVVTVVTSCLIAGLPAAARARTAVAHDVAGAATAWLDSLDPAQRALASKPFDDAKRTDWHFVPKPMRKGLQLRDMTEPQQVAALALLRAVLSQIGYDKSVAIMELDEILRVLEGSRAKNIRDPKRYFFTIFGTPSDDSPWAISFEGHHLSLNFTVRDGRIVDSTPQFMGANPAVVKRPLPNLPAVGRRVLEAEESVAFELLNSLDEGQRAKAVISPEPPKEIRGAGEPQPSGKPAVGIAWGDLSASQQAVLKRLVDVYCESMPEEVVAERLQVLEAAEGGWAAVKFAWAGSLKPGIGHYYRVEGPTFVVELCNVQPDAEGNPANHIHCIWRDRTGDFDLPVK